jgi:hypothetical protein
LKSKTTAELEEIEKKLKENLDVVRNVLKTRNSNACTICWDHDAIVAAMPCGHLCLCEGCSNGMLECPICRTKIDQKVKIFRV